MTSIQYDIQKSASTSAAVADFVRTSDLRGAALTAIPGVGEATAELLKEHNLNNPKDVVSKFNRFNRSNRTHSDVSERFFQWLRDQVGGGSNKHTITEAIETYVEEQMMEEEQEEHDIVYEANLSNCRAETVATFVRSELGSLTDVPGIGQNSVALFAQVGIHDAQDLVNKYRRFQRRTKDDEEAAQRFFQWQRSNVGGRFNKHTVTEAIQSRFLHGISEEP